MPIKRCDKTHIIPYGPKEAAGGGGGGGTAGGGQLWGGGGGGEGEWLLGVLVAMGHSLTMVMGTSCGDWHSVVAVAAVVAVGDGVGAVGDGVGDGGVVAVGDGVGDGAAAGGDGGKSASWDGSRVGWQI